MSRRSPSTHPAVRLAACIVHGPAIVSHHPIVRAEATDRRPRMNTAGGYSWHLDPGMGRRWPPFTSDDGSPYLPADVYDAIPVGETVGREGERTKGFADEGWAFNGLSAGLIAWAKGKCGSADLRTHGAKV